MAGRVLYSLKTNVGFIPSDFEAQDYFGTTIYLKFALAINSGRFLG